MRGHERRRWASPLPGPLSASTRRGSVRPQFPRQPGRRRRKLPGSSQSLDDGAGHVDWGRDRVAAAVLEDATPASGRVVAGLRVQHLGWNMSAYCISTTACPCCARSKVWLTRSLVAAIRTCSSATCSGVAVVWPVQGARPSLLPTTSIAAKRSAAVALLTGPVPAAAGAREQESRRHVARRQPLSDDGEAAP